MSIVVTIEEQTLCDVLTSNAVAPETDEGANGQHECAAYFQNFFTERHGRNTLQIGRAIGDLATRLFALTGGFPKRVGEDLFCRTENHEVRWLANVQSLFAWIDNQAKVNWAKGSDKVPQERFYAHLAMTAEAFDAVELVPHWPPMPGVYYLHPPLPPATDGHHFEELLRQFSPASPEDAAVASTCTPLTV